MTNEATKNIRKYQASAVRTYKSAYSYCKTLYDMRIVDIKTPQMQDVVDNADVGATTRARIQSLFRLIFKYALKYDYVKKDYSEFVKRPKVSVENERTPFSDEEIEKLWKLSENHIAQIVLIMIYTGWRPFRVVSYEIRRGNRCSE